MYGTVVCQGESEIRTEAHAILSNYNKGHMN